jgi:hypothetical protein
VKGGSEKSSDDDEGKSIVRMCVICLMRLRPSSLRYDETTPSFL